MASVRVPVLPGPRKKTLRPSAAYVVFQCGPCGRPGVGRPAAGLPPAPALANSASNWQRSKITFSSVPSCSHLLSAFWTTKQRQRLRLNWPSGSKKQYCTYVQDGTKETGHAASSTTRENRGKKGGVPTHATLALVHAFNLSAKDLQFHSQVKQTAVQVGCL